jgi:hypothetical protein
VILSTLHTLGLYLQEVQKNSRAEWRFRSVNRAYSEIDPQIEPLVNAMNATGLINTYASCQGHALVPSTPYVAFTSSPNVASALEMRLRTIALDDRSQLSQRWSIAGSFNEAGDLVFRLYAPRLDSNTGSITNWLTLGCFRQALDKDLAWLGKIVSDTIREERWQKVETEDAQAD